MQKSNLTFLNDLLQDIDNFEQLGKNLEVKPIILKEIVKKNPNNPTNGRSDVILAWLQKESLDLNTLLEVAESEIIKINDTCMIVFCIIIGTLKEQKESFSKIGKDSL